jgi:FKBP-type peptidyl-prolyl cis-trans isomerase
MATPKSQRIGIWIIAVVMLVGTIGSFAVMILANDNAKIDQAEQAKLQQKQVEEMQKQITLLSDQHYPAFKQYKDSPAAFDANAVGDKVVSTDLKQGDGTEVKKESLYQAYYIGWNPKGKVFDSSFDGEKLKTPFDTSAGAPIKGWQEGVVGMKVGGIRELTIPSDLAYGEKGSGDAIPPNTPIKFIVMVIAAQ